MRKKITRNPLALLFLKLAFVGLLISSPAVADMAEDDHELQLSGGFFHAQDSDSGTITAEGSYGYFFTPSWEVGIKQGINSNLIDGGGDTFTASTIPFLVYNFHDHSKDDKIVPFLGAFSGGVWNDQDFTGTLGPIAGAKIFVYEKTFLLLQYRYEWFFDDLELNDLSDDLDTIGDNKSDGNHVASIGFGVLF